MKWIKERDLLIAQTMAFVQSVTGKKPDLTASPVLREPGPIENPPSANPALVANEPQSMENAAPADLPQPDFSQTVVVAPAGTFTQSDVRKEVQSRVAAFQAHQHRFQREREAYFTSVLTKLRSAIENGPEAPSR
jgi:hypothetical protein